MEGRELKSRHVFSLHEGAWSPDRVEREMQDDPIRHAMVESQLERPFVVSTSTTNPTAIEVEGSNTGERPREVSLRR